MISPATIASVKERADLVAVVQDAGVTLRKRGASLLGLCPFHSEKTPSFNVRAALGYFHCFGCGEKGNAVDFVMKNEGLSFPEAVRELAGRMGIDVDEGTPVDRATADRERREREALFTVNALAAAFYERCLWGEAPDRCAPYAHEELERRQLEGRPGVSVVAGAALLAFRIGYAPASWRSLTHHLQKLRVPLETAERAGLLLQRDGRFHDRFRHRLLFPVLDHLGRVVGFSGRALDPPDERDAPGFRAEEKPAKYVNSPETPVYKKGEVLYGLWQSRERARERGEVVLVEGNFDVVALHARGVRNVVAPLGTAFTDEQAKLLRRFAPAVVVAFDGDKAGKKATWKARVPLRAGRLTARAATLPEGSDPDSFVRARGAEAIEDLVRRAPELLKVLLDHIFAASEGGREAQAKRVNAALKLLGEETDPTVRSLWKAYADQLSSKMVVDGRAPTDLRDLEVRLRKAMRPSEPTAAPPLQPLADPLSFGVVGALLDVPAVAVDPDVAAVVDLLDGDAALAALASRHLSVDDILAETPAALHPHVERRIAAPVFLDARAARDAVLAHGSALRARARRATAAEVQRAIAAAEERGDDAEVERMLALLPSL
jgi:DNA primase